MTWDDDNHIACDFETSGTLPEYALQPWRIRTGDFWATSISFVKKERNALNTRGALFPAIDMMREFLEEAKREKRRIVTWNGVFDISVFLAYGFEKLVFENQWLDGMQLWMHAAREPEYDTDRADKKSFGLKSYVDQYLPQFSGYQKEVDFHSTDEAELDKLQKYNDEDTTFTLFGARHWWLRLNEKQQRQALIDAECLPMLAKANLTGMLVDTLHARDLSQWLLDTSEARLRDLREDIGAAQVTQEILIADRKKLKKKKPYIKPDEAIEMVVRSPTKLAQLLYDEWGLPVYKETVGEKTKAVNRATDKEVLHELAFIDPRAKLLRGYREALNNRTKFAEAPLIAADYNGDGRAHPLAIPFGTYCVPGDVEVMTREGWVRLDQWGGGDIVQVRPDLSMEFLHAERYVGPVVSEWVRFKQQSFDCLFTHDHTVPYLSQKKFVWRVQKAGELSSEAKHIPTAGRLALTGGYTSDQMRLFAAVQADGYSTEKYLKFMLVKPRKVQRLIYLLTHLGVRHRVYVCAAYPERTEIVVAKSYRPGWLGHDKKFLGPWLLNTTPQGLEAFVAETEFWDGSSHKDGGFKFCSSVKANVEWVVTAAALIGRKAAIHTMSKQGMTECHVSDASVRAARAITPRYRSVVQEDHQAYCATTQTGFWLARSNGHIFVTGNSGRLTYSSKQGKGVNAKPIGWAVHQEKRGANFRGVVTVPPGYTLMEFDAAGQEFRWMAIQSKDATMLKLCLPGEDPHSYMGARIKVIDYHEMIRLKEEDPEMKAGRQLGKIANLCVAEGTLILTDRGVCGIERVRRDDLVWDGAEFVTHDGVVCSGVKPVISHDSVTATPTHEVLVDEQWWTLEEAARYGRRIQSALGEGWACQRRSAVRIMDGFVRRAVREVRRALREGAMRLWCRARRELEVSGDWAVGAMQRVRDHDEAFTKRRPDLRDDRGQAVTEARQRLVSTMPQPKGSLVSELRRTWDRVSVRLGARGGGLCEASLAARDVSAVGHRPREQRWTLRGWKLALGYAQAEPSKQTTARVYDLVNCGPRTRFAANGKIVHNSLQYRTTPKRLRGVARVEYNLPMEMPEAERIHATYKRTYPGVPKFWDAAIARAKQQGYVETLGGRRVQLVGNWADDGWKMGSTAINYPIQGTGACQKYLALAVLKDLLVEVGGYFMLDLHDGIYTIIPDEKVPYVAVEGKRRLDNLPYRQAWGFDPPIPLPWDAKAGGSWGALKDYKFS